MFTQNASGLFGANSPTITSSENVQTYLANALYHFTQNTTGYLRYATGYRPGGPSIVEKDPVTGLPMGPTSFAPDHLASYEMGLKAETPDRHFGADLSGYYIDWARIQLSTTTADGFGTFTNASGPAHIQGSELTLTARPINDLTLLGAFAYQHAYMTEPDADLHSMAGERLPNVPRFTTALNGDYLLGGGLSPTVGMTLRYVSNRRASFDLDPHFAQYYLPAYTSVDLRGGLVLGEENGHPVNVQLYIHNVLDERGQLAAQTQFGKAQVAIMQPRTIGLSAFAHF